MSLLLPLPELPAIKSALPTRPQNLSSFRISAPSSILRPHHSSARQDRFHLIRCIVAKARTPSKSVVRVAHFSCPCRCRKPRRLHRGSHPRSTLVGRPNQWIAHQQWGRKDWVVSLPTTALPVALYRLPALPGVVHHRPSSIHFILQRSLTHSTPISPPTTRTPPRILHLPRGCIHLVRCLGCHHHPL